MANNLNEARSVTLNASGSGTVSLGPDSSRGPAMWHIDGVIIQTTRPGVAPIPRVQVWLDQQIPASSQGLSYDGSFAQGSVSLTISRGQQLIAQWDGGLVGDVASITVTGTKE